MFDPRLTEEYCGLAGMPWSDQDGSGELAGMAIGASLWGLNNQANETGSGLTKAGKIGCQYGYVESHLDAGKPRLRQGAALRAARRRLAERDHGQHDRQALLRRDRPDFSGNQYNQIKNYVPHSYVNAKNVKYNPDNFINAALAGIPGEATTAAARSGRSSTPTRSRARNGIRSRRGSIIAEGFFFSANTLEELAGKIRMKYQRMPMPPANLDETVARYNSFVDTGVDADFASRRRCTRSPNRRSTPPGRRR